MERERVKTLILCTLVLMSIFLTQRIWFYSPAGALDSNVFSLDKENYALTEARDKVVIPEKMILSFGAALGNNYFTVINSEIDETWKYTKIILESYFTKESNVTPSTYEKYKEATGLKSVEAVFGKNMPSVLIASLFDSLNSKITGNIREIKRIVIPANNRGSIFIEGKDAYFEVTIENYENKLLADYIDRFRQNEIVKYYDLYSFAGSNAIMPINYNLPLPKVFSSSKLDLDNEERISEVTKNFFDENFNFVKTIRETSGTVQFMYGYGEKVVRINNKGQLEYKEEIESISGTDVLSAFDAALQFILKHGGFPEGAYLKEIKIIENGRRYFFGFGYRINGLPVKNITEDIGNPIEVKVYGNKIKSYSAFIRQTTNLADKIPTDPVLSPHAIIENHIEMLKRDYRQETKRTVELPVEEILKNIKEINMVYYDPVEIRTRQLLLPAWEIVVGNIIYYFDSYTGELLNKGFSQ